MRILSIESTDGGWVMKIADPQHKDPPSWALMQHGKEIVNALAGLLNDETVIQHAGGCESYKHAMAAIEKVHFPF